MHLLVNGWQSSRHFIRARKVVCDESLSFSEQRVQNKPSSGPIIISALLSTNNIDGEFPCPEIKKTKKNQQDFIVLKFEWFRRRRLPLCKWATRWPLEHIDCSSLSNEPTATHTHTVHSTCRCACVRTHASPWSHTWTCEQMASHLFRCGCVSLTAVNVWSS